MMKQLFLGIAALMMAASGALAADKGASTAPAPVSTAESSAPDKDWSKGKDWTLEHAREHAHHKAEEAQKYAEKLDKMTEGEWAEHLKKHHEWQEKMKNMTPEERKKYWQNMHKKREEEEEKADGKPTPDKSSDDGK